ncbi:MAG: hypothetical protein AB7N24_17305 [Dehalococcoidia bacterium]
MLNTRKGSTPLSYAIQPGAQYLYDAVTRRAVRYVETIVPTVSLADSVTLNYMPADRYYAQIGAQSTSSGLPSWIGGIVGSPTFRNYDTGLKRYYLDSVGAATLPLNGSNGTPILWPTGPYGEAASYTPKNATSAAVWYKFTAKFSANADYDTYGCGAVSLGATFSSGAFASASAHFFQVLRNAGNWELGSCDGSTISQSASSGGADGNFHEFWVRWSASDLKLYVDGVLVITKSTNLPNRPLCAVGFDAHDSTNRIMLADVAIEWELA